MHNPFVALPESITHPRTIHHHDDYYYYYYCDSSYVNIPVAIGVCTNEDTIMMRVDACTMIFSMIWYAPYLVTPVRYVTHWIMMILMWIVKQTGLRTFIVI